jgi:7-carboxy-7-deazaguanine synthase
VGHLPLEVTLQTNIQPIEKLDHREDMSLDVHSVFYTIQGEGPLTGHPAIFVRLAGCNLQCPLCDTDYTSKRERMAPEVLMKQVRALHPGPRLVVITGGEPFRQNLTLFVLLLLDEEYTVQIETNGTLPPPPGLPRFHQNVWIVCSPKTGKVHPDTIQRTNAWKYVLRHGSVSIDGLPTQALDHTARPFVQPPPADFPVSAVYVQPADEQDVTLNGRNLAAAIRSCMKYGYTLQLQIHKLIGME